MSAAFLLLLFQFVFACSQLYAVHLFIVFDVDALHVEHASLISSYVCFLLFIRSLRYHNPYIKMSE